MTVINPDGPLDPDWLVGPELDVVVEMFRGIDWRDEAAVEQRTAELEEWGALVNTGNSHESLHGALGTL